MMVFSAVTLGADAAPQKINYQGILKDSNGDPVSGTVSMTFTIYDAATGGSVLWQETHSGVVVDEGGFSAILGDGDVPAALGDDVFDAAERFVGITINADPELSPRTQMVSVPYSQRVSTVDRASAGTVSGTLDIETAAAKDGQAVEGADVKRIGPMGQDFYRLFGYGGDEKSLSARDLASIAVVAIQELDRKTSELDEIEKELSEMRALEAKVSEMDALEEKVAALEALLKQLLEDHQQTPGR